MLRLTNLRASEGGRTVAVMLDTKGPEIRMGGLKVCKETGNRKAKMTLVAGEALELTSDAAFDGASDEKTLYIDYPKLPEVVKVGDKVLLDDGLVTLRVTDVPAGGGVVRTEVLNSSEIGERKGVNLPGVATGLPAMSDKDKADIKLGVEHDIDMVAASFVRSADGVHEIRQYLRECVEGLAPAGPGEAMPGHFEPGTPATARPPTRRRRRSRSSSPRSRARRRSTSCRRSSTRPTASWWRAAISGWRFRWRASRRGKRRWWRCASPRASP